MKFHINIFVLIHAIVFVIEVIAFALFLTGALDFNIAFRIGCSCMIFGIANTAAALDDSNSEGKL